MWLNGYFTFRHCSMLLSSAAAILVRRLGRTPPLSVAAIFVSRHCPAPLSSSAIVLVHCRRLSVCQKSAPPHFTCHVCIFSPQNFSSIYMLQHLHISISEQPHFTIGRLCLSVSNITQKVVEFWWYFWRVRCFTSNEPLDFGDDPITIWVQELLTEFVTAVE